MTRFVEMEEEITKRFKKGGQGHVFEFIDCLSDNERDVLFRDLSSIDLEYVKSCYLNAKEFAASDNKSCELSPFNDVCGCSEGSEDDVNEWKDIGIELISKGKVGALLLAGGMGTRLGSPLPKGMYDLGLPGNNDLFKLQAGRLISLGRIASGQERHCVIPWYIMTSDATHDATKQYFRDNDWLGLGEENLFFFKQDTFPCLTPEGKLILENSHQLARSPNGNGGVFSALKKSGALEDMEKRGVEYIFQHGVDNCLVKMCDPFFLGYCSLRKADCGVKVVRKSSPTESVGVFCLKDGLPVVAEYSEMDPDDARKIDPKTGKLLFDSSHICVNIFATSLLQNIAAAETKGSSMSIPPHIAVKKIPHANEEGKRVSPESPNGWKLELFVFDGFKHAKTLVAFEVQRDEEFSPLKNAPGTPTESPDTCRRDISALHKTWLIQAGANLVDDSTDSLCEISPLLSYAGESLEFVKGNTYSLSKPLFVEKQP